MKLWPDEEPATTAGQVWVLITAPARVLIMIIQSIFRGLYGSGL